MDELDRPSSSSAPPAGIVNLENVILTLQEELDSLIDDHHLENDGNLRRDQSDSSSDDSDSEISDQEEEFEDDSSDEARSGPDGFHNHQNYHPHGDHESFEFVESPLLSEPAYPGSKHTLKQFLLLTIKFASNSMLSMKGLSDLLLTLGQLLPENHLVPPSTYLLFQLLGIEVEKYERHVCCKDCHVFPPLDPSEYWRFADETCPVCDEPRFARSGRNLAPRKKYYSLPLKPQLEKLSKIPAFQNSLQKMWESIQQNGSCHDTFWGGKIAEKYLLQMIFQISFFCALEWMV